MPRTVYVLGAGASHEVGLPVGRDLADEIAKMTRGTTGDYQIGEALQWRSQSSLPDQVPFDDLRRASALISRSVIGAASIDNFIDQHRGNKAVEVCAKIAIVHAILKKERVSKLYVDSFSNAPYLDMSKVRDTWYLGLWHTLIEGCTATELPKRFELVTFIVFNYDRCLEQFLYWALVRHYDLTRDRAVELLKCIQIIHPYGIVGSLPLQKGMPQNVDYGAEPHPSAIASLSQGIKTFAEGTDSASADVIGLRRAMLQAERIVFLGFAFHRLNLELLIPGGTHVAKKPTIVGTAFQISPFDTKAIASTLGERFGMSADWVGLDSQSPCKKLFEDHKWSLTYP